VGSKARHRRGLLPLLALLLLAAPIQAQVPEPDTTRDNYAANVLPQQGSASIEFRGSASIPITVEDVSTQATSEDIPRERNRISLSVDIVGNNTAGWAASLDRYTLQTEPGDTHEINLDIQAGATIQAPTVEVRVTAVYTPVSGDETVANASVLAVAESFPRLYMQMAEIPDDFEPDQKRSVPITVTNNNYYPDMASFQVNGPEEWMVSPPSSIRLAPGETKTVYIDVRSPENPWFLYTSSSDLITVRAVSETNGQPLVTTNIPVTQSGANVPAWVAPHAMLLLLGVGLITKRTTRKIRRRKLEKGKPSYPGLDPEHEAELEALKIEDPERADVVEDRLQTLYDQRKDAWKEAYQERQRAEEALQEAYRERHAALVDAREGEGPDPEDVRRRRRLLERKRALLERKRAQQPSEDEVDRDPAGGVEPS